MPLAPDASSSPPPGQDDVAPAARRLAHALALGVAWSLAAALLVSRARRGWIPIDEGCLLHILDDDLTSPTRTARILDLLAAREVEVVVLNARPRFSPPPAPDLVEALVLRYPLSCALGPFVIRWRR